MRAIREAKIDWWYSCHMALLCRYTGTLNFALWLAPMASMASMAPISAGQYHWVSEFAPPSLPRLASNGVGDL